MTYQPMVREIWAKEILQPMKSLVLAMIYTETKGKEGDVMQSSESASGPPTPSKTMPLVFAKGFKLNR